MCPFDFFLCNPLIIYNTDFFVFLEKTNNKSFRLKLQTVNIKSQFNLYFLKPWKNGLFSELRFPHLCDIYQVYSLFKKKLINEKVKMSLKGFNGLAEKSYQLRVCFGNSQNHSCEIGRIGFLMVARDQRNRNLKILIE